MRIEVIKSLKDVVEKEIIRDEIMIEFYEHMAESRETKEEKANDLLKASQIADKLDFNKRFREFVKDKK